MKLGVYLKRLAWQRICNGGNKANPSGTAHNRSSFGEGKRYELTAGVYLTRPGRRSANDDEEGTTRSD